ncbi:Gfo/Idh/MocA family oxidoreductase [Verrucomicrobiales bacterium]|nr:Gfo/Idh/MocA family oxidoreductase [Verrucomicrobiales bacterium]MDB3940663.1 Gfo/Idh/MocA family oxidoreductase [Verrucomicrobiales bacterium]MDC0262952.1 Gfo/Idh/MocA family oxidoreductase [Verrucomicrobiales bacterium]
MIRIGIIGCGRILAAHLEGYRILREAGVDNFEITALCSRKAEDAQSYVKRGEGPPQRKPVSDIPEDPLAVGDQYLSDFQPDTEVEVFTDFRDLIAYDRVDAINDFTIHSLHHQIAEFAFAAGKHVLSQKPLAVTMEGARRMCGQAEAAGVTFGVFENLRFDQGVRHQHWAFSDDGPAGELQIAVMGNIGTWWAPDLIVAETPWRHELVQGGGMALDLGPHFFDMIRYIGGGEIVSVTAQTQVVEPTRYLLRDGERVDPVSCDADDTFYAHFELESGAAGTMFGSWSGHGTNTVLGDGPVFYGSKGRVTGDRIQLDGQEEQSLASLYEANASAEMKERHFPLGLTNDFALSQLDWIRAIEGGAQPECSGAEGLRDLACAYAVVESDLAGREVSVAEVESGELREYQKPIDAKFGLE